MQSLRSLLCFGVGGVGRYQANIGQIFGGNNFKHLKVLNLLSIPIDYQYEIGVMVHLTYLAVQWEDVPESITNLFNLETLVLSNSRTIYLTPGIVKMDKLRHVCNKAGAVCFYLSAGSVANSDISWNLQTVYPLCGFSVCKLILTKSPRIKNLRLSQCAPDSLPDNLSFLQDLETLTAYVFGSVYSDPKWATNFLLKLPSSIKRLTLKSTSLEWWMISILGTLPNLEVLKLLDNACGSGWYTCEHEFPRLKCLKMKRPDITKWVGNDLEFKSLEVLSIFKCDQLQMLPSGLARAPRLSTLEVKSCNGYVKDFFDSIVEK